MLSEITILRNYPIINGYVQVPNNRENAKNALTVDAAIALIPTSVVNSLNIGSGRSTGGKFGSQQFLTVAQTAQSCCQDIDSDPAEVLATAATSSPDFPV